MLPRAGFAILLGVALPLACGSFGEGEPPATPGPGDAAAIPETSSPSPSPSPSKDAGADGDAGTADVCDRFQVANNAIGNTAFWAAIGPSNPSPPTPKVIPGLATVVAESSSSTYLQTIRRTRKDTIRYTAVFVVHAFEPAWGSQFTGWSRLFDLDASIDEDDAEYSGLELNATSWRVGYRIFDDFGEPGSLKEPGPPLLLDHEYTVAFEERFSPTDGHIHITLDNAPAITLDNLHNERKPHSDWLLKVGADNQGTTPLVKIDFKEVCVSP